MASYRTTGNVLIVGGSLQGKSVKANEDYAKDPRIGVYFEPDGEAFVTGTTVRSIGEIVEGMAAGRKKFHYVAPMFDMGETQLHDELVRWLMVMGEQRGMGSVLVTDEAHEIASEGTRKTSLHLAVKRGKKRGLRNVCVTQEPRLFANSVATLMDYYIYVGPLSRQDVGYFEREWKIGDASAWTRNENHQFCVIDRTGTVVDRGFADNKNYGTG